MRYRVRTFGLVFAVAAAALAPACGSSINEDAACTCLTPYGSNSMDADALRKLYGEGLDTCIRKGGDKTALEMNASCLPVTVGKDARTGKPIEAYYSCSDKCPAYGYVSIRYGGVEAADCCAMGGVLLQDFFGHYNGCEPPETAEFRSSCPSP